MDYKKIGINDFAIEDWDCLVVEVGGSYFHSSMWLNYAMKIEGVIENDSYALFDGGRLVAICSLLITCKEDRVNILAAGSNPLGAPVFDDQLTAPERRKVSKFIFNDMFEYAKFHNVSEIQLVGYPKIQPHLEMDFSFELLRYGFDYRVENMVAINLWKDVKELREDLSKYHGRTIKRGEKRDLIFKVNPFPIKDTFENFQIAHLNASGRSTRPQSTWDEMLKICCRGEGTLFALYHEKIILSYLFCGEFDSNIFAWSQVNIKEYEKEFNPRHLLEWKAILYYKERGFRWYEVGDRLFGNNHGYVPTEKDLSLSFFRERYGGVFLPKIYWRREI